MFESSIFHRKKTIHLQNSSKFKNSKSSNKKIGDKETHQMHQFNKILMFLCTFLFINLELIC